MSPARVQIKTVEQVRLMRRAGLVVAEALETMGGAVRPGVTTGALDLLAREVLRKRGATSSFLNYGAAWGYPPYPATACISVNEQVVHGIPGDRVLAEGDLVSIDFGAIIDGWHGDAARSFAVGELNAETTELSEVTRRAMWAGIAAVASGNRVADISEAIQRFVERTSSLGIVREYTGHGIGTAMHQPPDVPNYGRARRSPRLGKGMVLAIEPILTLGSPAVTTLDDDWTVATRDGSWAAHWENTVALLPDGLWVLTEPDGGRAELEALGAPVSALID